MPFWQGTKLKANLTFVDGHFGWVILMKRHGDTKNKDHSQIRLGVVWSGVCRRNRWKVIPLTRLSQAGCEALSLWWRAGGHRSDSAANAFSCVSTIRKQVVCHLMVNNSWC
jgi:prepilin-type processing-associated H-X9-DG protein